MNVINRTANAVGRAADLTIAATGAVGGGVVGGTLGAVTGLFQAPARSARRSRHGNQIGGRDPPPHTRARHRYRKHTHDVSRRSRHIRGRDIHLPVIAHDVTAPHRVSQSSPRPTTT